MTLSLEDLAKWLALVIPAIGFVWRMSSIVARLDSAVTRLTALEVKAEKAQGQETQIAVMLQRLDAQEHRISSIEARSANGHQTGRHPAMP